MWYDTRCHDLAVLYLNMALTQEPNETHRKELAKRIQQTIDTYLEEIGKPHP